MKKRILVLTFALVLLFGLCTACFSTDTMETPNIIINVPTVTNAPGTVIVPGASSAPLATYAPYATNAPSTLDMSGQCGYTLYWTFNSTSGTLIITGSGAMDEYTYPQPWASVADKITSVSLPQELTSIGRCAFYGCTNLSSLTIPSGVATIGDQAFYGSSALSSITMPNTVKRIGQAAFSGCTALMNVSFQGTEEQKKQIDIREHNERLLNADWQTYPNANGQCGADLSWAYYSSTGELSIQGSGAMYDFELDGQPWGAVKDEITSISLPADLTSIGKEAFRDCKRLTSVTIPSGVTTIKNAAFSGCTRLAYVSIPDTVTTIGRDAFRGCKGLTSITLPNSVTSLGGYAFRDCTNLMSVTLPSKLTSIEESTFFGCTELVNITIPDSVKSIGAEAFRNCSALMTVTIPGNVTSIKKMVFSGCSSLTNVTVPHRVKTIDEYAFYDCDGLETVSLPKSLTSIGRSAFENCTGLKTVYYAGKEDQQALINVDKNNADLKDATWRYSSIMGLSITKEPEDTMVRNKDEASFAVKTSGKVKSWQWYYRTDSKAKWAKVKNGTSAVLTVTAKPGNNGYQYYCEMKNAYGVLSTDVATLTVELFPPVITIQPQDVTTDSGEPSVFTVAAEGEELSYKWTYRKSSNDKWTDVKNNGTYATLSVSTKPYHEGYQYRCEVSNPDGKTTSQIATLHVVLHPPVITQQPEDVAVNVDEEASFTVVAEGKGLSYKWIYRKTPTEKWTDVKINGTDATYTTTGKSTNDGYQFRCEVTNSDGTVK